MGIKILEVIIQFIGITFEHGAIKSQLTMSRPVTGILTISKQTHTKLTT